MTPAYKFRIMAALPNHAPVELFRSPLNYTQTVWHNWTRDLSQDWQVWTEHTLDDKHCLSERPKVRDTRYIYAPRALYLTPAEKQIAGVQPEYET